MDGPTTARSSKHRGEGRRLRVCFVQAYRSPDYVRGQSIRAALEETDGIDLLTAVNVSKGWKRYIETLRNLLWIRRHNDPDIYLLGFRGHEIAWIVRWLTRDKPLVFDAMMSPWAAIHEENKLGVMGRLLAPLWRRYEASILHRADAVLTDTRLHSRFYHDEFELPADRLLDIPVGAVERDLPPPQSQRTQGPFHVLFYGSFLPLHGIDVIVEAASKVKDLPIVFDFIGGMPAQAKHLVAQCEERGIRHSHRPWVPFDELLAEAIPSADLCLGGPFGGTPQARRVVTGKTSQCMALGKPVVVGRIDEDIGLVDKLNCLLVPQANAEALADALRWAFHHREQLPAIGARGQSLYLDRLSIRVIASRLVPMLQSLAARRQDS